jgi:hypothetical protein
MTNEREGIRQVAADLAAASGVSLEDAVSILSSTLIGEAEPIRRFMIGDKLPRWKTWIPGWRRRLQRRIFAQIEEERRSDVRNP